MKRGILKCAMSFAITIVMVLGMLPMGDAKVVEAAENEVLEIKASECESFIESYDGLDGLYFRENNIGNYKKVKLIMDVDMDIDDIHSDVDLTISGTKTLTAKDEIFSNGSIYLEKNVSIVTQYIGSYKGAIYSEASVTMIPERYGNPWHGLRAENGIFITGGSIECKGGEGLFSLYHPGTGKEISLKDANINVNNINRFVSVSDDDSLSISGCNMNIDCQYFVYGVYGYGYHLNIDNSNISCGMTYGASAASVTLNGGNSSFSINDNEEASENVFFCESFNFNGGTLSLSSTKSPIKTPENGIKLGERCYVSTPEGGTIQSNGAFDFVADADGNEANTVVLSERAVSNGGDDSGGNNSGNDGNSGNAGGNNSGNDNSAGNAGNDGNADNTRKYSNEWVDGKWYNAEGLCNYEGILCWKCNSTGWWVEDTLGWYPMNQWLKIDGKWYYFLDSGYMDYSEYRDGCYLGSDGAWVEEYYGGHWCSDSTGWWYEDASGWYPSSQWLWIDGKCYYFEANGYLATNKYIDGYWVGSDGAY